MTTTTARLKAQHPLRAALGRLSRIPQRDLIRIAEKFENGEYRFDEDPLELPGMAEDEASLALQERRQELLRSWLAYSNLPAAVIDALVAGLKPKVSYVRYFGSGKPQLLVENR